MAHYVTRAAFDRSGIVASHIAAAFGRRVALRRTDLEMTQETMIRRVNRITGGDLGRSTASMWENGHGEPSISTIAALAEVLDTHPAYLAYGVKVSGAVTRHFLRKSHLLHPRSRAIKLREAA